MKISRKYISAIVGIMLASSSGAHAGTITEIEIIGGTLFISGTTPVPLEFTYFGPDTNVVGDYINDNLTFPSPFFDPDSIVELDLFTSPFNTFTSLTGKWDTMLGGGPIPIGTAVLGGDINMDMRAWGANWNGTEWFLGNEFAGAVGGYVSTVTLGGEFLLGWDAPFLYGPFSGEIATFCLSGTVSIDGVASTVTSNTVSCVGAVSSVPIPASVWLFGSGLIGLIGVAGRKSA